MKLLNRLNRQNNVNYSETVKKVLTINEMLQIKGADESSGVVRK